jgi:hypothetical protein
MAIKLAISRISCSFTSLSFLVVTKKDYDLLHTLDKYVIVQQGVASGAQAVSSTLEQAAKTVSTDMPAVVSFAASTAKSVLNSLHGVDSSVRRASSLVTNTINSLPAAAATPFVAGAPGAAVTSGMSYLPTQVDVAHYIV